MSRDRRDPTTELAPFLLTTVEAAQVLRISPHKLRELKNAGEISHIRIGRLVRYPRVCVQQFVSLRATGKTVADPVVEPGADQ